MLEGLGNKCEMIVFKAVPLATKLYAGVSGIYQLKIKTCKENLQCIVTVNRT